MTNPDQHSQEDKEHLQHLFELIRFIHTNGEWYTVDPVSYEELDKAAQKVGMTAFDHEEVSPNQVKWLSMTEEAKRELSETFGIEINVVESRIERSESGQIKNFRAAKAFEGIEFEQRGASGWVSAIPYTATIEDAIAHLASLRVPVQAFQIRISPRDGNRLVMRNDLVADMAEGGITIDQSTLSMAPSRQ